MMFAVEWSIAGYRFRSADYLDRRNAAWFLNFVLERGGRAKIVEVAP